MSLFEIFYGNSFVFGSTGFDPNFVSFSLHCFVAQCLFHCKCCEAPLRFCVQLVIYQPWFCLMSFLLFFCSILLFSQLLINCFASSMHWHERSHTRLFCSQLALPSCYCFDANITWKIHAFFEKFLAESFGWFSTYWLSVFFSVGYFT